MAAAAVRDLLRLRDERCGRIGIVRAGEFARLLQGITVVQNIASAPDSSVQQPIGIAAAEFREEAHRRSSSELMPRCESENKWIVSLLHAATARPTTYADATFCGFRLS
jgi:ABC-type branched-subunit amino acid transport system ATPase component